MPAPPAWAGIHRGDQLKARRKLRGVQRPGDNHPARLQGLTQRLQGTAAVLGQFVQEQHAIVRQADLAGARPASPSHQGGNGCGMVRRAKRRLAHQGLRQARQGGDGRRLKRL
ncbi:hypothetical protein D3C87_1272760 [compost metagenome]